MALLVLKPTKQEKKDLRVQTLKEPASPQTIRTNLNLSQSEFASLMGVSRRVRS